MTKVLERFHAAGALVTPRDPETDGTAPFILVVKQVESDYWSVTWWACPTGSASFTRQTCCYSIRHIMANNYFQNGGSGLMH